MHSQSGYQREAVKDGEPWRKWRAWRRLDLLGMDSHAVSDQLVGVERALGEFIRSLTEAVAIAPGASSLSMG